MLNFVNNLFLKILFIFIVFFIFTTLHAETSKNIIIEGNDNIDNELIYSIIGNKIEDSSENNLNNIIKTLYSTGYFKNIEIENLEKNIILKIKENPSIRNVSFTGNKRFKKEEIFETFKLEDYFQTYNEYKIDKFINDFTNLYASFGYNVVKFEYEIMKEDSNSNFVDIQFNIDEGKISKINKIYFIDNITFDSDKLRSIIKSKQASLIRLFGSTNYKEYQIKNDLNSLINFYKQNGFRDIKIKYQSEFISSRNKFNIYFYIEEGTIYNFKEIKINQQNLSMSQELKDQLLVLSESIVSKIFKRSGIYNSDEIQRLEDDLSEFLYSTGNVFFDIKVLEKIEKSDIYILISINDIEPKYVNQINVAGNTRTKDKVIRREIPFAEGDAINNELIKKANRNLNKLGFFQKVNIKENSINDDIVDVEVEVEESSTGQFQVGVSLNSFDGATFISGLDEKNIMGDGRELNFTVNTSSENTKYIFGIVEPYIFNRDIDFIYDISYEDKDLSSSSSYELSKFDTRVGFQYGLTEDLDHSITLEYELTDYTITNDSTASDNVKKLAGNNADILLNNKLIYDQLDSFIRPTKGTYFTYGNTISPPTNDDNGYFKNSLDYRKYYRLTSNIFSIQTKLGNIISLQDKELPDNQKFSLGGRWLRGFDRRGAGPRNSRTSYVGGKNIIVTKIDAQRPLLKNSDNPVDLNLFLDAGTVFDNKTTPTFSDESIRASYGIGIKFYSIIGPIGFSWAFPIAKEDYDIEKMFTFSIGYLN